LKLRTLIVAACAALSFGPAARAGEVIDRLSQCLVENASPKDQATLVKWMFSAVSANPALKGMAPLTREERDGINKALAMMFERLMLQDCRKEVVDAMRADGSKAVGSAFELMGKRAAEQLLSDPASAAELEKMSTYLDTAKWEELAKEAGPPVKAGK
jgi:hypothetical protein